VKLSLVFIDVWPLAARLASASVGGGQNVGTTLSCGHYGLPGIHSHPSTWRPLLAINLVLLGPAQAPDRLALFSQCLGNESLLCPPQEIPRGSLRIPICHIYRNFRRSSWVEPQPGPPGFSAFAPKFVHGCDRVERFGLYRRARRHPEKKSGVAQTELENSQRTTNRKNG